MTFRISKNTPPRLAQIFQSYDTPIYFVTINTWQRMRILDQPIVHASFIEYARSNAQQGRCIGRYVFMPDHIHLFVRLNRETRLNTFIRLLKQHLGKTLSTTNNGQPRWQPGFFDHLLRHGESYTEKWEYVRQNPVRAGLVTKPEDWPYQGEIERLEF